MKPRELFQMMVENNASDIFVRPGSCIYARILTEVRPVSEDEVSVAEIDDLVAEMTGDFEKELLAKTRNCEFACYSDSDDKRWRFRVSIFYQKNNYVIVIRKIDLNIMNFKDLNLPGQVLDGMCRQRRGLILLTGITGSGKSTTIASMIEHINENFGKHIVTFEEPIEFIFSNKKSMINQRELGRDVMSYEDALRHSIFHSPDVIYVGNIKDKETCHAALTAAETGALVFSTVHSVNATSTVERLINFFPAEQHAFIFNQLSFLLKGVVSQRLLPRIDKEELIPAYEVMTLSATVSSLINKAKVREIPQCLSTSEIFGMNSFNQCLLKLVIDKKISVDTAMDSSDEKSDLNLMLKREKFI